MHNLVSFNSVVDLTFLFIFQCSCRSGCRVFISAACYFVYTTYIYPLSAVSVFSGIHCILHTLCMSDCVRFFFARSCLSLCVQMKNVRVYIMEYIAQRLSPFQNFWHRPKLHCHCCCHRRGIKFCVSFPFLQIRKCTLISWWSWWNRGAAVKTATAPTATMVIVMRMKSKEKTHNIIKTTE